MDYVGRVPVPEVAPSGTFPIRSDWPWGRAREPKIAAHAFGSANAKVEQRFLLGSGATRWMVRRAGLKESDRLALRDFWEARQGPYQPFTYQAPNEDGTFTARIVRFENAPVSWEQVADAVATVGLWLVEEPASYPSYSLNGTNTRFPSSSLQSALLAQVQELIPLVRIRALEAAVPDIWLSDRRCTVGGQLYQARLLRCEGISQNMCGGGAEGASDEATFIFGNADRVMRDLSFDTDLDLATVEYSIFHVGAGIKLDFWKGYVVAWERDCGPEFTLSCSDGLYELMLPYPSRTSSRLCWKHLNGPGCPYSSQGSGGDPNKCDRGYDTPNGCKAHNMRQYFGGVHAKAQGVLLKSGRNWITHVSMVDDSIYERCVREIYTDRPMAVDCDIAEGREENEFYAALGVIGEGPLDALAEPTMKDGKYVGPSLDEQPHHGFGKDNSMGLRWSLGADPAPQDDYFSLGQVGNQVGSDPEKAYVGNSTYERIYAAGTAFLDIRRTDEKGIQPTRASDHKMRVYVERGLKGQVWNAPGSRYEALLTNPVWVAVNALLKATGRRFSGATEQEQIFDAAAAAAAGATCELQVPKLVGSGNETQFTFRGNLGEQQTLRDWLEEILSNCLGYWTWNFGRMKIGLRMHSGATEAFTVGNVLLNSLRISKHPRRFNHLSAVFANEDLGWKTDSVPLEDVDETKRIGYVKKSQLNLCGTSTRSQAARLVTTRLREELGGLTASERAKACDVAFKTTVLALNVEPGMIISITDAEIPGGYGEFRVTGWRLEADWSVTVAGSWTTDSMYDLIQGDKPQDVTPGMPPAEELPPKRGRVWFPNQVWPAAGDPMFPADATTFGLTQVYEDLADGTRSAVLEVAGRFPVNAFIEGAEPPAITGLSESAVGGTLPAGGYYFSVCAVDASGNLTPPSNAVVALFQSGTTNQATLTVKWPVGTYAGCVVFAGTDSRAMCRQFDVGGLPQTIVVNGPLAPATWAAPFADVQKVRIKAKRVIHAGPVGTEVNGVPASNAVVCASLIDAQAPLDDWTGRVVSIIGDASDGSAPLWNFTVTAFDASTGRLTFDRDCVVPGHPENSVEVGDVLVVRHKPTFGADWFEDSLIRNVVYPSGMVANREVGNLARVIAGKGEGIVRRIASNTDVRVTVEAPWGEQLDATSIVIVEEPAWTYAVDSNEITNMDPALATTIRLPVANLLLAVLLVQGVTVDRHGYEPPDDLSPAREIYLYGELSSIARETVEVSGEVTLAARDQIAVVDTTLAPAKLTLPPAAAMKGKKITVKRVTGGGNSCDVFAAAGDTIDGQASISLPDQWSSVTLESQG